MKTQNENAPMLVLNPVNGKYVNLMPFFEFTAKVAGCAAISEDLEDAIDWMATTLSDEDIKGRKENIAYRLVQLKHLLRKITELPTDFNK